MNRSDKPTSRTRNARAWLFQSCLILLIAAFAVLAFLSKQSAFFPLDLKITRWLQSTDSLISNVMKAVSWPGYMPQSLIVVSLMSILLYLLGLRWESLMLALSSAFEGLLNYAAKLLVHRPRPSSDLVRVMKEYASYSFPSGHVMFYTVLFGFAFYLTFVLMRRSWCKVALLVLFSSQVVLIGVSRVYLGEHWASDALGAYLLGCLALLVVIRFYRWGKPLYFVKKRL